MMSNVAFSESQSNLTIPLTKLYLKQNLTDGLFRVQLTSLLGNQSGNYITYNVPVQISATYYGAQRQIATIRPFSTMIFNFSNHSFLVFVNETYYPNSYATANSSRANSSSSSYQQWAQIGIRNLSATTRSQTTAPSNTSTTTIPTNTLSNLTIPLTTVYVGNSLIDGKLRIQLQNLGAANANGISPATLVMYYNTVQTNVFTLLPHSTTKFTTDEHSFILFLNSTYAGNVSRWASIGVKNLSSTITPTPPITTTTVTIPRYITYTLSLNRGWNLFSVPMAYAVMHNTTCESGMISSPIWQLANGSYRKVSSVSGGFGYWVRSTSACSVTFFGSNMTYSIMPSLSSGWSSIGAPAAPTAFSYIAGSCNAIRLVGFNTSSNSYYDVSTSSTNNQTGMHSGAGYLIKVSSACSLGNNNMPPSPP